LHLSTCLRLKRHKSADPVDRPLPLPQWLVKHRLDLPRKRVDKGQKLLRHMLAGQLVL